MKLVRGIRTIALSALILSASTSCTTDGTDPAETAEEENRVPDQGTEEVIDGDLPTPEAASAEAQKQGEESIDSNSQGDVQKLASEQQLAVDESANAVQNGAGQEIAAAPVAGAEGTTSESPALPEAPIAQAEAPATTPAMPAEVAPTESIPTIADVVADSESSQHADSVPVKAKKAKGGKVKKAKHARAHKAGKSMPAVSGNEKVYIVQPGDTLGSIASTLYGNSRQWKAIAELNGIDGKSHIFPGDALKYSANEQTAAYESRYDGLAKASVNVERGDTLTKIAARVMGQASYWKLIWHWNEATLPDPNKLAVGQALQYISAQDLEGASSSAGAGAAAH